MLLCLKIPRNLGIKDNFSLVILLVYLHMLSPSIDERISHKFHTR